MQIKHCEMLLKIFNRFHINITYPLSLPLTLWDGYTIVVPKKKACYPMCQVEEKRFPFSFRTYNVIIYIVLLYLCVSLFCYLKFIVNMLFQI
jgi:hypothetical protein